MFRPVIRLAGWHVSRRWQSHSIQSRVLWTHENPKKALTPSISIAGEFESKYAATGRGSVDCFADVKFKHDFVAKLYDAGSLKRPHIILLKPQVLKNKSSQ